MLTFVLVVQALVAAALVGIILMQKSEGGGLGTGGSPSGLMSARGAADFLTRTTKWLAVVFVTLAIVLAAVAVDATTGREFDDSLDRTVAPASDPLAPAQGAGSLNEPVAPVVPADAAPAESAPANDDPLAGVAE